MKLKELKGVKGWQICVKSSIFASVMGILYIVPTPVGNMEDMTLRAIRILKEADLVLAEDTRTSGILLKHFQIQQHLLSHHKFNEHGTSAAIVSRLLAGENVALISDAGTDYESSSVYVREEDRTVMPSIFDMFEDVEIELSDEDWVELESVVEEINTEVAAETISLAGLFEEISTGLQEKTGIDLESAWSDFAEQLSTQEGELKDVFNTVSEKLGVGDGTVGDTLSGIVDGLKDGKEGTALNGTVQQDNTPAEE